MNKYLSIFILLALLPFLPAFSNDPFNYFVEVKNFKEHILSENVSRFRLSSSAGDFTLIETYYQKITKRYEKDAIKKLAIRTGATDLTVSPNEPSKEYLINTRYLNLDSPEINQAVKQLKNPGSGIRSVEDYVYAQISDKLLGIPMLPANQIIKIRRGDCTEHSVLSVAILRKLGIPARAVAGMYLADSFRGRKNIFVYHMWAEAFYKGKWRLVDATMPGKKHLNRYIAFAYHNLKTEAPLSYLRAISSIQNFSVEYIDE